MNAFFMLRRLKRFLFLRVEFWNAYFSKGEFELKILKDVAIKEKISLDVGGNIGVYTYHLARLSRRVFTFEPNPQYVSVIRDLMLPNVVVESAALSDADGLADLMIPIVASGKEDRGMATIQSGVFEEGSISRKIQVPLKQLDSYDFEDIGFIKIDVEGHEEAVLRGGWQTIQKNRPPLLIEIEERHNPGGVTRIVEMLSGLNYLCFFYWNGERRPFADFDPAAMQDVGALEAEGGGSRHRNYVNNFLFLPHADAGD